MLPVVAPCCSLLFSGLLELAAQADFTADHGSAIGSTGPREENSQLKLAIPADHGSVIGSAPPRKSYGNNNDNNDCNKLPAVFNAKSEPLFDTSS